MVRRERDVEEPLLNTVRRPSVVRARIRASASVRTLHVSHFMKTTIPLLAACLLAALTFTSCETPGQTALLGAGTGAIIGNQSATGPLRGAAIGAGIGYLVGKIAERRRGDDRYYEEDEGYDDRDDRYYREDRYSRHPVARLTNRRGFVSSPYRPFNLIDVRGIPSGAKVLDPSNDRIFINP